MFVIIMLFKVYVLQNVEQEPDKLTPVLKNILISKELLLTIGIFFLIFII